ncbi:MAG: arginine repressor [Eubacterium sp.]|nr:arginine repressor [Eubacterium sp.]
MKIDRQKTILKLISERNISTQEELQAALQEEGVITTQATISRDIRELGLRKKHVDTGVQKYVAPEAKRMHLDVEGSQSYIQILASGITEVHPAGGLVVVKTYSGMAMAVAAAIDSMRLQGVVGCIAGDDTIFVAVQDESYVEKVMSELRGKL